MATDAPQRVVQIVRLFAVQSQREWAGLILAAVVMSSGLWGKVPALGMALWLAVTLALLFKRRSLHRTHSTDGKTARRRYAMHIFLTLALGAAFGTAGWLALQTIPASGWHASTVGVLIWLSALSVLSVGLYAGLLPPVLAFSLPALLIPAAYLLSEPAIPQANLVAVLLAVQALSAVLAAYMVHHGTHKSLLMEGENTQLRIVLDQQRQQSAQLAAGSAAIAENQKNNELRLREQSADLELAQTKAKLLSDTIMRVSPLDALTGIANRKTLDQHLEKEWRRAMREKKPLTLIGFEIDQYDEYLRQFGDSAAEGLLKRIARLANNVGRRAADLAARVNGARFALLLPGCDARNAARIADALRKRVLDLRVASPAGKQDGAVSAHFGTVSMQPTHRHVYQIIWERMEAALQEAAEGGGNHVVAYLALKGLRIERWDIGQSGEPTAAALASKIEAWGYQAHSRTLNPGALISERAPDFDTLCVVLGGQLKIIVEEQETVINAGDCVFIPNRISFGGEIISTQAVAYIEATRPHATITR